jgi:hypothetical protein
VFRVSFASQSDEGLYEIVVGPAIRDLTGNWMDQDQDGWSGEFWDDRYVQEFSIDRTGPRVASHSPVGVQNVAVDSFELTFSEAVDASTLLPDSITVSGPAGSYRPGDVIPLNYNQLQIVIPANAIDGTYRGVVAPTVTDRAGNLSDQDADGTGGETEDDAYEFSFEQRLPDLIVTDIAFPQECRTGQQVEIARHSTAVIGSSPPSGIRTSSRPARRTRRRPN